ncbi:MAG: hypothetical protein F6K44_34900, partial [Moorea sp. SIO3E2]|nr:hypothetical protein [Moorena sp. SIO3E2]
MSEYPKKVSNNDLNNSKFRGGLIDADKVYVGKNGGDNYNIVVNSSASLATLTTRQEKRNRQ